MLQTLVLLAFFARKKGGDAMEEVELIRRPKKVNAYSRKYFNYTFAKPSVGGRGN